MRWHAHTGGGRSRPGEVESVGEERTDERKVRSWGINDNAALGRQTVNVADPSNPDEKIPNEELEAYPYVVQSLVDEGFRAVQVAAGDSVSVAVSDKGLVRAWGSFRVSSVACVSGIS